jgi:hypothetical protein
MRLPDGSACADAGVMQKEIASCLLGDWIKAWQLGHEEKDS